MNLRLFYGILAIVIACTGLSFASSTEDCCPPCVNDCQISSIGVKIKPPAGAQISKYCSGAIKISITSADRSVLLVDNASVTIDAYGNGTAATSRTFNTRIDADAQALGNVLKNPVVSVSGHLYGCSNSCENINYNGYDCWFSNNPTMYSLQKDECKISLSLKAISLSGCNIYLKCCAQ